MYALRQTLSDTDALRAFAGRVVFLDGNIAGGKTTLATRLRKLAEGQKTDKRVGVYLEQAHAGLLELFYSDPARYWFSLQQTMGILRTVDYERAHRRASNHGHAALIDRGMVGNLAFACLGSIANGDTGADGAPGPLLRVHLDTLLAKQVWDTLSGADLLYLHAPAHVCAKRAKRRGEVEADVDVGYFEQVEAAHLYAVVYLHLVHPRRTPRTFVCDWSAPEPALPMPERGAELQLVAADAYRSSSIDSEGPAHALDIPAAAGIRDRDAHTPADVARMWETLVGAHSPCAPVAVRLDGADPAKEHDVRAQWFDAMPVLARCIGHAIDRVTQDMADPSPGALDVL